jgi:nicotinamide phosphoribosyltransferase
MRVPMLTVVNTKPEFFWLTNYLETCLSAGLWKSCATATIAYEYKKLLREAALKTGVDVEGIAVQAHDFSFRGMSGIHDAIQHGAGHLTSFIGTDTVAAIDYLEDYYNADGIIGVSVPATEHSVMCMGTKEDEDTWDFWQVITEFTVALKDKILARETNELGLAKVVFRPDSGDPVKIICGDPDAPQDSPAYKGAVECLWEVFGGTETEAGYKVLHERVGLIYGDSITLERAKHILDGLAAKGFASSNVVLGIGSYTYQYMTRDSFGFAMKATWGQVNGEGRDIFKDPITDSGLKKSAKGLLRVEKEGGDFVLYDQQTAEQETQGAFEIIFEDGELILDDTLENIRARLS